MKSNVKSKATNHKTWVDNAGVKCLPALLPTVVFSDNNTLLLLKRKKKNIHKHHFKINK